MIKKLKDYDFTLMIAPLLLTGFGTVMIYSASMVTAVYEGHESTYYLIKQLQWFFIGFAAFVFCSMFKYKNYQKMVKPIMISALLLLAGLFLFGREVNHANSWYDFGIVRLQPAEFAKLALILYLASIYSKKQSYINDFNKGVLPPLVLTGILIGLILIQPDIGTSGIVFVIACSIIFSSGIKFKHLFILIAIGLVLVALMVPNMVTDERIARFTGAYQPFDHPDDDGYHLIQSYLAIGVGGMTGEGLGQSVQKLGYLQEAHTDFIMAVIAEELGFVGVILVVGMLLLIVLRGIFIARKCRDSFGSLLAIGISSMVGIQAFVNLGAISGVLPITGVPLPFVSYGGSSLLVLMISMGILNNIAKAVNRDDRQPLHGKTEQQPDNTNAYRTRGGKRWLM